MARTVGEVSKLAKVSVRTLHHYDAIGLVGPSDRSEAGYRLYESGDLERLQQVLFFKELGFSLDEIRSIMAEPSFDRRDALRAQRSLLAEKARRTEAMLTAIDLALDAMEGGYAMDEKDMFEVFGDFDPKQYEDEVRERWGDTDAYKESARRTKRHTKDDWQRIKAEDAARLERMVALFDEGVTPQDPRAMDAAEEARLAIDRDYYPCSREMHVNLGRMYVADPRFTAYYDKHREGLAQWFCSAIEANAERS
jgi:MerR family transcriptional regulator, thiopeptide resistance regulator